MWIFVCVLHSYQSRSLSLFLVPLSNPSPALSDSLSAPFLLALLPVLRLISSRCVFFSLPLFPRHAMPFLFRLCESCLHSPAAAPLKGTFFRLFRQRAHCQSAGIIAASLRAAPIAGPNISSPNRLPPLSFPSAENSARYPAEVQLDNSDTACGVREREGRESGASY